MRLGQLDGEMRVPSVSPVPMKTNTFFPTLATDSPQG